MDRDSIATELAKDLDRALVKQPPKGKFGEYISNFDVFTTANDIFGWDGWSYTVDRLEQTNCDPNQGQNSDQWAIGYMAVVMVRVGDAYKQDVGHGQGHNKSAGEAHDSAAKEAVTDALKRALRTFGNPLGLALYDKTKAHVSDNPDYAPLAEQNKLLASLADAPGDELIAWKTHNWTALDDLRVKSRPHFDVVATEANRRKEIQDKAA